MDFNVEPFYDDFEASNGAREQNYMRILFRPGYAVQARELTQLQTIIQNQIKEFGNHIFKSGSPVHGGHMSIDTCTFLRLNPQYQYTDIDVADFNDNVILNYSGNWGKRAKVIAVYDSETQPALMIRPLRGNDFEAGETIQTPEGVFALVAAENYTGTGSIAYIEEGIFYVNGFFVYVEAQTIVLDVDSTTPSYKIGLQINESVWDESSDAALLDPAQESFNYQAPGAHRYRFALDIAKKGLSVSEDGRFFELLRVENGVVTKRVDNPIYSDIDRTLARRSADATGNFIVDPFEITIRGTSAGANAIVELGAGKAYVNGYEFVTVGPQRLNLDKARTTATATDYDLSLEYGNRLYANNFTSSSAGMFDIAQLPKVHLHCVPKSIITLTSSTTYTSTYMGTARVINFDRNEGSEYSLNLVDIDIRPNTVTLTSGTASASNVKFPTVYSATNNAYVNVIVSIASCATNQSLVGVQREIISYDGATRSAYFDRPLPTNDMTTGDKLTLKYQIQDIESIVRPTATNTAFYDSMDISSSSRYGTYNYTNLSDTTFDTLIFPLPEESIANNAFTNTDFYHKHYLNSVGGIVSGSKQIDLSTATSGLTFYYGTNGSTLSVAQANTHFIVIPQTITGTSTFTVGTPIAFTSSGTPNITRIDSGKMTINFGATSNVTTFSVIASVKSSTTPIQTKNVRTKIAVPATGSEFTQLRSSDTISGATNIGSGVYINYDTGVIWNQSPNKTPNGYDILYIPDVYALIKVYDSANPLADVTSSNGIDITSRYYLDSGQRPAYYDHARIKLKPNAAAPKGRIAIIVRYYKHDETKQGYFNAYSYPGDHYSSNKIPVFKSNDGRVYNLRDCVDFRPARKLGDTSDAFTGMINPMDTMELTYQYYLPRVDKIILTPENGIELMYGTPSKFPSPPYIDYKKAMELYTLSVPAYTYDLTKIGIVETNNKRYTMKDIGALENRIQRIEYYTAMTTAEVAAKDKVLLYNDLTQKEKYGIIADGFADFSKADTTSQDLACAIEFGTLAARAKINNINMKLSYADPDVINTGVKAITLPYTETVLMSQTKATGNVSVMNYIGGKIFKGTMFLQPESDEWFSEKYAPFYIGEQYISPQASGQVAVTEAQASYADSQYYAITSDDPTTSTNEKNTYTPLTILGYDINTAGATGATGSSTSTSTSTSTTTTTGGKWGGSMTAIAAAIAAALLGINPR